jgi:hypothetical protein
VGASDSSILADTNRDDTVVVDSDESSLSPGGGKDDVEKR